MTKDHTFTLAQAAGKLPEWHTPLPWAATTRQGSWDWVIYSTKDPNIEICQLFHDGTEDNETGEANAELIVRAVNALAAQPPAAPVEPEDYSFGEDYGRDLLTDLNRLAHHRGTGSLHRDCLQRAFKEITRLRKRVVIAPNSSAESVGCGTLGCTDPNCDYGKGPLRCQSCGAVVIGEPQEAPNRENLRPFAEWANRNRSAVSHEAADELILLARKACDAYGPLSRPHGESSASSPAGSAPAQRLPE